MSGRTLFTVVWDLEVFESVMSGRTLFSVVWDLEVFDSVMSGRTVLDLGGVGSELLLCSIALVDCRLYIANLVFPFIGESELERSEDGNFLLHQKCRAVHVYCQAVLGMP